MMGTTFDAALEIEHLKADYVAATGEAPFKHFFCPILFEDEDVELCAGHVVNECLPNSCRARVVQRKDIDGYYGSLVEGDFALALNVNGRGIDHILGDEKLRARVPWSVSVDGKSVEHYVIQKHHSPSHPIVHLQKDDGEFIKLALKMSAEEISETAQLQITVDRDYTPHAIAALLKAAHLTMFGIFGYQYVFSAAGQDVARILRQFYLENRNASRQDQLDALTGYFSRFAGMVIPLSGYVNETISGSMSDNRFMVCVGSSGHFFALGVLIRTQGQMSIVLLAPDRAELMDTYISFTKEKWKNQFRYHLTDFVPANDDGQAYWKGYRNLFVFDPFVGAYLEE